MQLTPSIVIGRPDESDVAAVRAFAEEHGLTIASEDAEKRTVKVSGSLEQLESAFSVKFASEGGFLHTTEPVQIPPSLDGIAIAVLGLDQRPIARRAGQ